MVTSWLSVGLGVNSTALSVLLCEGRLPSLSPFRFLFADTGDEKPETYDYMRDVYVPYLKHHGFDLEVCRDKETVLGRWQRLGVTGNRTLRTCTDHGKLRPLARYLKAHGQHEDVSVIGIAADEAHRARPARDRERRKVYPLVEMDIDRWDCIAIIERAGLSVPVKSGCWHCPFMRVGEVLTLAKTDHERFRKIVALEMVANRDHPGRPRTQWGAVPALEWARRACTEESAGPLFRGVEIERPCVCDDGGQDGEA